MTQDRRTVIICCYTEDRWPQLVESVESAVAQIAEGDDVVVVVDHNDRLLSRARDQFADAARVVPNHHTRGLSGARNTGVELAAGDIAVFLDDDASAEPGWLDALSAPFADPGVVGVGGAAAPKWAHGVAPGWMPDEFYWVIGCSYRGLPVTQAEVRNPIGCNMAFRTEAIRRAGGFSARLGRLADLPVGAEETDLAIRVTRGIGGSILYEPAAVVNHAVAPARMRRRYFVRRCYWEGVSKAILAEEVGVSGATSSERAYLQVLARGIGRRIVGTFTSRSIRPLEQAMMIVVGLGATGLGFMTGSVRSRIGRR